MVLFPSDLSTHLLCVQRRIEAVWIARASLSQPYFEMCDGPLLRGDIMPLKLHTVAI